MFIGSSTLRKRDLAARRRCQTGEHTPTSSISINGQPRKPMCSWCGKVFG